MEERIITIEMKLKNIREKSGLTLETIAGEAGLTPLELLNYEKHPYNIPASVALILAKIYKTTVDSISFE